MLLLRFWFAISCKGEKKENRAEETDTTFRAFLDVLQKRAQRRLHNRAA